MKRIHIVCILALSPSDPEKVAAGIPSQKDALVQGGSRGRLLDMGNAVEAFPGGPNVESEMLGCSKSVKRQKGGF